MKLVPVSKWVFHTFSAISTRLTTLSAKDKENLFTLFYRGEMHRDGENKKEVEGYGIGMTLAHKIIHLHDGNIAVHSEQGKGTIFVVEIPHI
jgi:signal transduction histidine kinase